MRLTLSTFLGEIQSFTFFSIIAICKTTSELWLNNSIYKDDYTFIDFWIDRKLNLPAKVVAVTTEEDIYEIKFLQPKVNKAINKKVFDFEIPKKFGEPEIIPLKEK